MDSKQVEAMVKTLKGLGFKVEKDDAPTLTVDEVLAQLTPEQKKVILAALAAEKAEPAGPETEPKAAGAHAPAPGAPAAPENHPMMKRDQLPADVRKELEEAAEVKKRLDKLLEQNEAAEFLAKAAELKYLAGASTAEIAKAMRAAKKAMDEKEYATFVKILTVGNKAIETSAILKGIGGVDHAADGEPVSQLDSIAKKMVTDGKAKTYQEALRKALKANPELYAEHKAEIAARSH